ncbi:MAG: glutamate racemase [Chitinophagaceae bacterium]|nr:glutamate racemase [Chitinophagaceae bacterium]
MQKPFSIGVFDSGYGGLTVLKEIVKALPQYDYMYLGDNARAPYGNRSFETVNEYTKECVDWFFEQGCHLVILACNTASAKALRNIQQTHLPTIEGHKRVLGVIRPTAEVIGNFTQSKNIGVLATSGTVQSQSYSLEIKKFFPDVNVYQQACPMWVPLIENNAHHSQGADYFVKEYIHALEKQNSNIDCILLACTHFPLLMEKIIEHSPVDTKIIAQGEIVAASLKDYLERHPEIEMLCSKDSTRTFYTSDSAEDFDKHSSIFYGESIQSTHIKI